MNDFFKSWRTTLTGIIAFVIAAGQQLIYALDNDPATSPEWTIVTTAFLVMVGLIKARDNKVSSERAGAE